MLFISSILLILGAVLTAPYGDFRQPEVFSHFWWGIGVMSLGFILSWKLHSLTPLWFWGIAIATRLLLLPMYPGDDVWRYLWEGYIQIQGFSPYDLAPNAIELIPYRTEWWLQINHKGVSAIYPPITQLGFRTLTFISPHFIVFKAAFVSADLLVCWLLAHRFGYSQTTLYAWNPLVIYSFAGGAHYDSWFILPLVAAWLWFDSDRRTFRWLGSALLLGISVAVKWISLPIFTFLGWQVWRKVSFKQAIIVLICASIPLLITALPFCHAQTCPLIPINSTFVKNGRSAEFIPFLLAKVWQPSLRTNSIFLFPLGIVGLFLLVKVRNFQQFAESYFFWLLTLSPIIHGWYFTWIVPFAVPTQNLGVRLLSVSGFIYFVLPYRKALGHPNWHLTEIETWWLWLPFILGYFWTIWRQSQHSEDFLLHQDENC